jgi:pyrroloquinoline quinone (PQQ) biosynthesis protein C
MGRQEFFAELDRVVDSGWEAARQGPFWQHVISHGADRELYQRVMVEMYHYTRHNAVNQAFAAWRASSPEQLHLLKFCFEHADEELGHEKMIVHDLEAVGLFEPELLEQPPLPPTQALIGYLYYVGLAEGPIARLGYSYWAESSYGHLDPLLQHARQDLDLTDERMTFFVAHSNIDQKHAEEVREAIAENAVTPESQAKLKQVAATSLYLTSAMLDAVLEVVHGRERELAEAR